MENSLIFLDKHKGDLGVHIFLKALLITLHGQATQKQPAKNAAATQQNQTSDRNQHQKCR